MANKGVKKSEAVRLVHPVIQYYRQLNRRIVADPRSSKMEKLTAKLCIVSETNG